MGWSNGGYISAFCSTYSSRFKAISVGGGITNWSTHYVNTDIPYFIKMHLGNNPWNDPEIYTKTSPMTYIKSACTPTLIQHGEKDARIPISNAYELYQGLRDMGVDTEFIVKHPMEKRERPVAIAAPFFFRSMDFHIDSYSGSASEAARYSDNCDNENRSNRGGRHL